MKFYGFLIVITGLFFVNTLFSQDEEGAERVDLTVPNNHHKLLYNFGGQWRINYVQNASTQPSYGKGTARNDIIFGARFVKIENKLEVQDFIYTGYSILGYDNTKEKYTLYRMDNLNTNPLFLYGTWDDSKKELIFEGMFYNLTVFKEVPVKIIYRLERENKFVLELYQDLGDGIKLNFKAVSIKSGD